MAWLIILVLIALVVVAIAAALSIMSQTVDHTEAEEEDGASGGRTGGQAVDDNGAEGDDSPFTPPVTAAESCAHGCGELAWCDQTILPEPDPWGEPVVASERCRPCGEGDLVDTFREGCENDSPGVVRTCDYSGCSRAGGVLTGCGGNQPGECTARRACAPPKACVLTSPRDDCSCAEPLGAGQCTSGTELSAGGGCRTCTAATRQSGYHHYRADAPLLRQPVRLYVDVTDGTPRYRALLFSRPNYADAGPLLLPAHAPQAAQAAALSAGDALRVNTTRGVVHPAAMDPPRVPAHPESSVTVRGFLYDSAYAKFLAVLDDATLAALPAHAIWDAVATEAAGGRLRLAAAGRPAVLFTPPPGPPADDPALAVRAWSQRELGIDTADPSLFDFAEFSWASGDVLDEREDYLGDTQRVLPPARTMDRVLALRLPRGAVDPETGAFTWDGGPLLPVHAYNRARPDACLSCRAREQHECPAGTLLIGCGFTWSGYCGSCFQDAEHPCGNCQSTRLRAALPDGRVWTDAGPGEDGSDPDEQRLLETGPNLQPEQWPLSAHFGALVGTADHAAAADAHGRLAAACTAMPPAVCRWEPNELRLPGGAYTVAPQGGLMTVSTRGGARLPPFCCAPGDARLDGPAGAHCTWAKGEPYFRVGDSAEPGAIAWTVQPRVGAPPAHTGIDTAVDPLDWPELALAVEFYARFDGTGSTQRIDAALTVRQGATAFRPQACRLSALTTLVLRDGTGAERVWYNPSVRMQFLVFAEVGWADRATAFTLSSVIAHPSEAQTGGVAPPTTLTPDGSRLPFMMGQSATDAMATRCYTAEACGGDRENCESAECHIRGMGFVHPFDIECRNTGEPRSYRGGKCLARGNADLRVWR